MPSSLTTTSNRRSRKLCASFAGFWTTEVFRSDSSDILNSIRYTSMSLRTLDIDVLATKADNIYETVVVLSKRARQISAKMKQDLDERSEEHTSELQSRENLVCRLLLE